MSDVIVSVEAVEEVRPTELSADVLDEQLIGQLVDRARASGLQLTGGGGLLQQLTKRVLESALDGEFTAHHAFMTRHYLDEIDRLNSAIAMFDARIASLLAEHEQDLDNLDTIPGVGQACRRDHHRRDRRGHGAVRLRPPPRLLDRRLPRPE